MLVMLPDRDLQKVESTMPTVASGESPNTETEWSSSPSADDWNTSMSTRSSAVTLVGAVVVGKLITSD